MKPYDPMTKCPKCGSDEVGTAHHAGNTYSSGCCSSVSVYHRDMPDGEHMHRKCHRCGYEFAQSVIEQKEVESK